MNGEPIATDVRFFSLTSRIGRARFLAYNIGLMLLALVPGLLCGVALVFSPRLGGLLMLVLELALLVMSISLMVRRLHDLDKSGWWALLAIVPLVNLIFLLYLIFAPGTVGENGFGLQPPPNTTWVLVGAWAYGIFTLGGIALVPIALGSYQDFIARAQMAEAEQLAKDAEAAASEYSQQNKDWPPDLSRAYANADPSMDAGRYTQSLLGKRTADGYAIVVTMKSIGVARSLEGKSLEVWTSDGGATWHCGPGGPDPVDDMYLGGYCRESGAP